MQSRARAPEKPAPAAPKAPTPSPRSVPKPPDARPPSGQETPPKSERASLVRSMMQNIEGAPAAPPDRPRIPPEPPRRERTSPVQTKTMAREAKARKKQEQAELGAVFDVEPTNRIERARRAAERVRLRARTEPAPPPNVEDPVSAHTSRRITPNIRPSRAEPTIETPRSTATGTQPEPGQRQFAPKPLRVAKTRMFAGFEWDIASRYLRARRKEGFISVIAGFSLAGIGLGVATLIVVMAVMTGFRETLIEQIVGVNPHASVVTQQEKFENYDSLAIAIRQVDGVTRVVPSVEGEVLASTAGRHGGVGVRGIRREDLLQLKVATSPEASVGSLDTFTGDDGIAIGDGVARKLGVRVGDSITLVSPEGDLTPFGVTPRSKSYPVAYIFKLGLTQYDNFIVYMPLREAQLYFNKKGVVDSLQIGVVDPNNVAEYVQPIREAARSSIGVYTWKDLQGSLIGALDVERNVMFLILTLIILVAALNIISGLVMLVKDKSRDVAILRTMGMSRGAVLRIFFICGSSIGVIGSVIGCILGVLFVVNIGAIQGFVESIFGPVFPADVYGLSGGLPAVLEMGDVMFTLCMALFLSFIATLYPAWKASNLDPVDALRYE